MVRRRPKSGAERLTTLLHLVRLGAGASFADISTKMLGDAIDLSQQAASLRIIELEKAGLIERAYAGRGPAVRLTDRGLVEVETFLAEAANNFEKNKSQLRFRGKVFTGYREGRYYVSLEGYAKPFRDSLGFVPFPGTLNLRLAPGVMVEQRRRLNSLNGIQVPGFEDGQRTFGPVKCFKAQVGGKHNGAVLAIERTHYDDTVLEVISPLNLRKVLKLKDGVECAVTVYPG